MIVFVSIMHFLFLVLHNYVMYRIFAITQNLHHVGMDPGIVRQVDFYMSVSNDDISFLKSCRPLQ